MSTSSTPCYFVLLIDLKGKNPVHVTDPDDPRYLWKLKQGHEQIGWGTAPDRGVALDKATIVARDHAGGCHRINVTISG